MARKKHMDPFLYLANNLREAAFTINNRASAYEALSKGLRKASKGDFIVLEAKNVGRMPVHMGIYDGISIKGEEPTIQLLNPAYVIKYLKTGKYNIDNDHTEQLFFSTVVSSMVRNFEGKSTVPKVHRETTKNKREKTAEEVLQKYGCSTEQYKQLYASIPQLQ